ncbi:MAG: FHA domain-containing protein [Deltaproteobacteria bacterium]|nr:FHA domain-containing protein [Deltaproteobacteria bacterium]
MLRAMAGLPHDTTVVIERRVTIGRASDTDLQLADPEVSRRHAKVELDAEGRVMLIDLSSMTGTFVDGVRIERRELRPGDEIAIARFRLRYEEVHAPVAERKPPPKRGMEVLRQTHRFEPGQHPVEGAGVPTPLPEPEPQVAQRATGDGRIAAVLRDDTAQIVVPVAPRMPAAVMPRAPRGSLDLAADAPLPARPVPTRAVPRPRPVPSGGISAPRGGFDGGDLRNEAMSLVRSVYDYRWLRLQQLRGELLDHVELARLDELEGQLQLGATPSEEGGGLRRYRRFGCAVPAWIARFDGRRVSTAAVALEDISAGGAQVRAVDALTLVESCWLIVDLETTDEHPVVVFRARVVWSLPEDQRVGVVFSGSVASGLDGVALVRADAGV